MSAKAVKSVKSVKANNCLVVSNNGEGENLLEMLKTIGLAPVPSGTGREGVEAIGHYRPEVIIIICDPKKADDILVLRAIQAYRLEHSFPKGAVVISAAEQVRVVERLLTPVGGHRRENCRYTVLGSTDHQGLVRAISALTR